MRYNPIYPNERVEVYWNLHANCLSARPTRKGGRVLHLGYIRLSGVRFAVQPAGREKVLREKRKNVHAFVRGITETMLPVGFMGEAAGVSDEEFFGDNLHLWTRVTYNPYRYESFVVAETGEPVYEADEVIVFDKRIWMRQAA